MQGWGWRGGKRAGRQVLAPWSTGRKREEEIKAKEILVESTK